MTQRRGESGMVDATRESVFAARNSAEEKAAEEALEGARIEYNVTTEATEKPAGAVCFLSIVYQVRVADASRARAALEARGLQHGILPAGGRRQG